MDFKIKDGCLIKYTGEDTDVAVPEGVTSIGNEAFSWCRSLTSVTIPNGVTSIGDMAFCNSSLTSVTIPDSVTSIGDGAFSWCSSLKRVTIPNGVTSIEKKVFHACSRLISVKIPDSVTSIGIEAFRECDRLTRVKIPDGVTSIGGGAFSGCSRLTSVTIPDGVTSIRGSEFRWCSSLTSVTIPNSVTSIGFSAFSGCVSLTNIVIPNTVQELSTGAFYGCSNLQTIRMSNDHVKTLPFYPSPKTVTLELTKAGEVVETVPAVFRKSYPSGPKWIHKDSCLVPIGKDEISYFDHLIAAGTYDGFTINENGRVAAILWRLNKKDVPIKEEILPAIREFLIGKLSKTIKYAIQEQNKNYIIILFIPYIIQH